MALGGIGVIEHLHGAFGFQLGQAALELFLLADIGVAQQGKVLRLEARDRDEVEGRAGAERVADGELAAAGQANDVAREGFVAAAPRGASLIKHRGKLTERDLEAETVLLLEDGHCLRDQALEVCKRAGAVESVEVRATSLPTLVQMVAGGLGVTLLPEASIPSLVQRHGPVALAEFAKPVPGRNIGLAWRTSSGRLREFRLLAETMGVSAEEFLARSRENTRKLAEPTGRPRRS